MNHLILREAYVKIKLYNGTIKTLYDAFGAKGSKKAIFLKTLIELNEYFDKINPNGKDEKGNIILDESISIEIDNKEEYSVLKKIGKVKLFSDIEKNSKAN